MSVKHSTQHHSCLVHAVLYMARVISQHTLLDDAESPGQFLHFLTLLLKSTPGPEETPKSTFPTVVNFESINRFTNASCVDERVGIVVNWCTLLPQFPEAQPSFSQSQNTRTDRTRSKQHRLQHLCSIRTT